MKISVTVPDIGKIMADEIKAGERAVQAGIRDAGASLKDAWRAQVQASGLGPRLARTIRSDTWPKDHNSVNAASMVWTRAPVILSAHSEGALIRASRSTWLAIPTEAAGRGRGGKRLTPREWEQRTGLRLVFIYRRGRPSLLVAEARLTKQGRAVASRSKTGRGLVTAPIFIMVPQVSLRKRLDLETSARAAIASLPAAIERRWSSET